MTKWNRDGSAALSTDNTQIGLLINAFISKREPITSKISLILFWNFCGFVRHGAVDVLGQISTKKRVSEP